MTKEIYFDMDGTIANLYGVEGWLNDILNGSARPYEIARPLVNLSSLARVLNRLQREGYKLGVISWLAKGSNAEYDEIVTKAKVEWLAKHLPSVEWDEINIVAYGTYKEVVAHHSKGILFDDEKPNRDYWNGVAYDVDNIIEVLKNL